MKKYIYPVVLIVALSAGVYSCKKETGEPENRPSTGRRITPPDFSNNPSGPTNPASPSIHLTLGNPSNAVANTAQATNYLMAKPQFALSYNSERGIPNWVSWHLDASWVGSAKRQDDYRADVSLPAGWYHVSELDYDFASNGFDRGHNCPSGDRTNSVADNSATFLMTNMIPQAPRNNQFTWGSLEDYCRKLASQGNELYIIMGNYGVGGTGSAGYRTTIAGGKVTVPSNIWKVVVVLPNGDDDINRITSTTRVIAINTPNDNSVNTSWGIYRTSVDAIEAATGYDLLSKLPESLQAILEARVDVGPTN